MYVKSLELKNFRNHTDSRFEFGKGFNVITGRNAAGKTNVVEAVFLCCIAKSPRADADRELVEFGRDRAFIRLAVERREGAPPSAPMFFPARYGFRPQNPIPFANC